MLIAQKIANLLGGVSQRPSTQRFPNQAEEQINALSSVARGVMKRPPSQFVGTLTNEVAGWDDAFVHVINRDEDERYHIVVANGEIKAFDAVLGISIPVDTPYGTDYLVDTDVRGFRAVTVGDTTIITNRGIKVEKGTKKSDAAKHEALIYIRQADFSTVYNVTINDVPVTIRTVDMDNPASRQGISTEAIASDILAVLQASALVATFVFVQYGASIHVMRSDGKDFKLSTTDGLADQGLRAVKSTVQSFEDLPALAPNEFVVEVTGSIDTAKDNYFVKYDDLDGAGGLGVWRECPQPSTEVELDETTMPHQLRLRGTFSSPGGVDPTGLGSMQGLPVPRYGSVEEMRDATNVIEQLYDELVLPYTYDDGGTPGVPIEEHGGGCIVVAAQAGATVSFVYDVDLSMLAPLNEITVSLYKNGILASQNIHGNGIETPRGTNTPFFSLEAADVAQDDTLQVIMFYRFGGTPNFGQRARLYFTVEGLTSGGPFFFYEAARVGKVITIGNTNYIPNSHAIFPAGAAITLTLDETDVFVHTVGDADETQEDVRAGLAALVIADTDYDVVHGATVIQITNATVPLFAATLVATFPANTFHNASLTLTPDELIGLTLENLTDSSVGVITANTATTITVAALTGGGSNSFRRGDVSQLQGIDEVEVELGTHFVFEPIPWKERGAGSLTVIPFPSFVGFAISEVFFYQNRLGFLSKENIILSSSGDLFNVFRYTATDLRADDNIDVRSADKDVTLFDSAFLWNRGLYIKSNNAWFRVSGEPVLMPSTIRLDPIGNFPSSKDPRPTVVGERVYFTRAKSDHTQVFELRLSQDGETAEAADITAELPSFLKGAPLELVGDSAEKFLAVVTSAFGKRRIFVRSWHEEDERLLFDSWSYWEFPLNTQVIGLGMADGMLGFIRKHPDGAYFEQIDFDLAQLADEEKFGYLDRRLFSQLGPSGWHVEGEFPTYDVGATRTTWTLPYAVAVDGSEGEVVVVNRSTGVIYVTTRPTATTVAVVAATDLTEVAVYIGQPFRYRYKPTTFFIRGRDQQPETGGRLQVRKTKLFFTHTTDFTVEVAPNGRTATAYVVNNAEPGAGFITFPVLCQNIEVFITITNDTPGSCSLSEIDWEGWFTGRSKRI